MSDVLGSAIPEAVRANADRLGLRTLLRPATVESGGTDTDVLVTFDGDTGVSHVMTLIGVLPAGTRVMCLMDPPHGAYIIGYLEAPAAHGWDLTTTVGTSVPTATIQQVAWDTVTEDTDGYHSGADPGVVIPAGLGGVYLVSFYFQWDYVSTTNDTHYQRIAQSGSYHAWNTGGSIVGVSGGGMIVHGCAPVKVAAGGIILIEAHQAGGVTRNVLGTGGSRFTGYRVSG